MAVAVLCVGQLMIVLDSTAVTVALPTLQRHLGFTPAGLAWVVDSYLMTFGGFLLVAGRLGDLVGRKRVFLCGLVIFTCSSLACGLARDPAVLVAARFLQGTGAAVDSSMVLAILVHLLPEPELRTRAMSTYALVSSVGGSAGVLIGGLLTSTLGWYWIFFINVPIGVIVFVMAGVLLPQDAGSGIREGVDLAGAVLVTATATLAVYGLVGASDAGFGSLRTAGSLAASGVLLATFVLVERRSRCPLVPYSILQKTNAGPANLLRASAGVGLFGMMYLGVLYVRNVLGYSPLRAGLSFLPLNIAISLSAAFAAAPLMRRLGVRWALRSALLLLVAGLVWLGRVPSHGDYLRDVLPPVVLLGVAAGLLFLPSITFAMGGLPPSLAGLGSGLANTALQLGSALGVSVLATVSSGRTRHLAGSAVPSVVQLAAGYHLAYLAAAAAVGLALFISLFLRVDRLGLNAPEPSGGGVPVPLAGLAALDATATPDP